MSHIVYTYDELRRLTGVVAPGGETGVYTYDAVGNLLSIEQRSSSIVSIIEFRPKSASAGTQVTIHGTGFSETPGENTVMFNGVPAAVVSATATRIVTSVPSGAATGPITVAAPNGSNSSDTPFTVIAAAGVPVITGFSPTIGTPGTPVTVAGANFEAALATNTVTFNRSVGLLSSASVTAIDAEVPRGAGSGRIAVSTPSGRTVSSEDFFVPPAPYVAADVEFTGRATFGDSKTVTVNTANKIALIVFDGIAGRRLSVDIRAVTISRGSIGIFNPDSTRLVLPLPVIDTFIEPIPLPLTGSYALLVDPDETNTGSLALTLYDVPPDLVGALTIGGPSTAANTTTPGQNARLTFEGSAGQRVSLGVSEVSFDPGPGPAQVSILNPDGTQLAAKLVFDSGDDIDAEPLPQTGTHTVVIDPRTARLTLTLSEPITAALALGGPPVPVALDRPGQDARLTFEGSAGQRVRLGVSNVSFDPGSGRARVSILGPDGRILVSRNIVASGGDIDINPLPDTGIYLVVVNPQQTRTASLTLTLTQVVP